MGETEAQNTEMSCQAVQADFFSTQHLNLKQRPLPIPHWQGVAREMLTTKETTASGCQESSPTNLIHHLYAQMHVWTDSFPQPTPARVHPWRPDAGPACQMR